MILLDDGKCLWFWWCKLCGFKIELVEGIYFYVVYIVLILNYQLVVDQWYDMLFGQQLLVSGGWIKFFCLLVVGVCLLVNGDVVLNQWDFVQIGEE